MIAKAQEFIVERDFCTCVGASFFTGSYSETRRKHRQELEKEELLEILGKQ